MKTIKDLTPEIRSKIQSYKDRCTKDLYSGKEYANYDRNKTVEYIERVYSIAGFKKPVVIVADNPNQYKMFWEILKNNKKKTIELIYFTKNKLKLDNQKELNSELDSELQSELDSELRSEL